MKQDFCFYFIFYQCPRSGVLQIQKLDLLRTDLLRTQSSKVLPLEPEVGQYSHACCAYCQEFFPC